MTNYALNNYREVVKSATPAQIESATQWYADAELLAHDVVEIFRKRGVKCNLENAASVISSFSPRQRWSRNVVQALEFANGGEPKGLTNNLRMAQFSMVDGFKALNGMKTNAFAKAIAGDVNAITIDVWMIKAAGYGNKNSVNKSEYRELSDAVNVVAFELGLTPRTTQALIWIIFRGSAD
jgi:hypothetical protein